jgi:hypothetical protein
MVKHESMMLVLTPCGTFSFLSPFKSNRKSLGEKCCNFQQAINFEGKMPVSDVMSREGF